MPEAPKLAKATLQEIRWSPKGDVEMKNTGGQATEPFAVQFNPATLKVTYSNQKAGGDQPAGSPVQFVGKGTTKLSLELVFDTTVDEQSGPKGPPQDVRAKTGQVFNLMKPTPGGGKKKQFIPPGVRFHWGSFLFDGVVDSMDESLEFFSSSGVPLRATVSLALSQQDLKFQRGEAAAEAPGTSPFEEAKAGDSLQQMAAKAGNSDWKGVALANGIENPRKLAPGTLVNMSASGVSPSLGGAVGVGGVALGGASFGIAGGASAGAGASFGAGASVGAGASLGAGFGAGASAGASASASANASASASASASAGASASADADAAVR